MTCFRPLNTRLYEALDISPAFYISGTSGNVTLVITYIVKQALNFLFVAASPLETVQTWYP